MNEPSSRAMRCAIAIGVARHTIKYAPPHRSDEAGWVGAISAVHGSLCESAWAAGVGFSRWHWPCHSGVLIMMMLCHR